MLTKRYVLFGLAAAAVASAFVWFGGSGEDTGGRVTVAGTVLVKGAPLPKGRIFFTPDRGTLAPAVAGDVENGNYRLTGAGGVMPGTYRVRVTSGTPTKDAMLRHARTTEGYRRGRRRGGRGALVARVVSYEWPHPAVVAPADDGVELGFTFPASESR